MPNRVSESACHKTLDTTARGSAREVRAAARRHDAVRSLRPDTGRTVIVLSSETVPFYMRDPTRDALPSHGFRKPR